MNVNQEIDLRSLYQKLHSHPSEIPADGWEKSFNLLVEWIITDFHPASLLEIGCASGFLVKHMRERGVEAWGINASNEIIQHVVPEAQPYCQVGSLSEPLPLSHYDLILCIDVLEHLAAESAENAVRYLCQSSNAILVSCAPSHITQQIHLNNLPPEYWTALFMQHGFIHDINYEAEWIGSWVMCFRKSSIPVNELVQWYDAKLWLLKQENELRRTQGVEQILELSAQEHQLQHLKYKNEQLQADLEAIINSTSWQFMLRVQNLRKRIIPIGSRREAALRLFLQAILAFRREGPVGFIVLTFQKIKARIELEAVRSKQRRNLRSSNVKATHEICEISSIINRPQVEPHTSPVDIIICVHNALTELQSCLDSLFQHTSQPFNLILVDDGSDEATAQYLRAFSQSHPAKLLRSDEATGYTYAANRGMRISSAEFVVLINSDTILTPEWLDRSIACIQSNENIGIVGPLSNTASWQSVPKIEQHGDWASNPLPEGITPARMAQLIAANSGRLYPEMPLLNGFCLIIRRALLENVGLFDEEHFGKGYGEEDDLVLRARKQGWKMVLADDVFIYHAQSKSYSSEKRHALAERAGKILREKHGAKVISQGIQYCQYAPVLEGIRARAQVATYQDHCITNGKQYSGKKILFIIPISMAGGGANVIRGESLAMQQMGVRVEYFNLIQNRLSFTKAYPDLSQSTIFGEVADLQAISKGFDAVIATYNPTVNWLSSIHAQSEHPILGYYVQGFEPWMYVKGSQAYKTSLDSYTLIDDMRLFTKTEWTQQQVEKTTGRNMTVVGPSVDIALNRPRVSQLPTWPEGPIRIAAMIRPESPYREPLKTMQLLYQAWQKYHGEVEIQLFGTTYDNPAFSQLPHDFSWKLYGLLRPEQVANLLGQTDIFVDYSSQQAMGLTAMEAMACGCAVIVPQFGGAGSYAVHEQNSLVVDTSKFEHVWDALKRLVEDQTLREKLRRNAIYDICWFFPEQAALNILNTLFNP